MMDANTEQDGPANEDLVNPVYGLNAAPKDWVAQVEAKQELEQLKSNWAAVASTSLHAALLAMRMRRFS